MLLSELFMSMQGEGPDVGGPAVFVRLHGCPVQCPGCDTHYTWDGSEAGNRVEVDAMMKQIAERLSEFPGCSVVLTGGEPLIQYHNHHLVDHLLLLQRGYGSPRPRGLHLETSGVCRGSLNAPRQTDLMRRFLSAFDLVVCSPKVIGPLVGQLPEELMVENFNILLSLPGVIAFKFVVRTASDVDAVARFCKKHSIGTGPNEVFVMPFGQERDELLACCEAIVPAAAKHGFRISPRLHSLIWGKERNR